MNTRQTPPLTNRDLFLRQKETLDTFLKTGAITQAQHDYSLHCLSEKMHLSPSPDAPAPPPPRT